MELIWTFFLISCAEIVHYSRGGSYLWIFLLYRGSLSFTTADNSSYLLVNMSFTEYYPGCEVESVKYITDQGYYS